MLRQGAEKLYLGVWWKTKPWRVQETLQGQADSSCGGCELAGGLQEPHRQETLILTGQRGGTSLNTLTGD